MEIVNPITKEQPLNPQEMVAFVIYIVFHISLDRQADRQWTDRQAENLGTDRDADNKRRR